MIINYSDVGRTPSVSGNILTVGVHKIDITKEVLDNGFISRDNDGVYYKTLSHVLLDNRLNYHRMALKVSKIRTLDRNKAAFLEKDVKRMSDDIGSMQGGDERIIEFRVDNGTIKCFVGFDMMVKLLAFGGRKVGDHVELQNPNLYVSRRTTDIMRSTRHKSMLESLYDLVYIGSLTNVSEHLRFEKNIRSLRLDKSGNPYTTLQSTVRELDPDLAKAIGEEVKFLSVSAPGFERDVSEFMVWYMFSKQIAGARPNGITILGTNYDVAGSYRSRNLKASILDLFDSIIKVANSDGIGENNRLMGNIMHNLSLGVIHGR